MMWIRLWLAAIAVEPGGFVIGRVLFQSRGGVGIGGRAWLDRVAGARGGGGWGRRVSGKYSGRALSAAGRSITAVSAGRARAAGKSLTLVGNQIKKPRTKARPLLSMIAENLGPMADLAPLRGHDWGAWARSFVVVVVVGVRKNVGLGHGARDRTPGW